MERIGLYESLNPKKKKRTITMAEKKWLWQRKKRHICPICHRVINDFFDAEFDHKRAYAKNGATTPSNTLVVHKLCNRLKGKKSLSGIKKHLGTHKPKTKTAKKKVSKKKTIKKKKTTQNKLWKVDINLGKMDFGKL